VGRFADFDGDGRVDVVHDEFLADPGLLLSRATRSWPLAAP
jgi:hypothetical protein